MSTGRLSNIVVEKPFIVGNASFALGTKQGDASHRWTVYLRGVNHEDMSHFIKEVSFVLHESFQNPIRVIKEPPYEVTELGWGEFNITIHVTFHDESKEPPVTLIHQLKLFGEPRAPANITGSGAAAAAAAAAINNAAKRPVVSERYDEFVFVNPTAEFYKKLRQQPVVRFNDHPLLPFFTTKQIQETEEKQISKLLEAQEQMRKKTEELRAQLFEIDYDILQLSAGAGAPGSDK